MEEIYIFGHKNPDTDSIVSAIVLEKIEKNLGINNVKACRIGNTNKETQYALKYFNAKEPELINSVEKGQKVMLVDHNGFDQSVNGIENAEILKDWDEEVGDRITKLVFIGQNMDKEGIISNLHECEL